MTMFDAPLAGAAASPEVRRPGGDAGRSGKSTGRVGDVVGYGKNERAARIEPCTLEMLSTMPHHCATTAHTNEPNVKS